MVIWAPGYGLMCVFPTMMPVAPQERTGVKMIMIQDGPMPTGADKPLRITGDPYKVQVSLCRKPGKPHGVRHCLLQLYTPFYAFSRISLCLENFERFYAEFLLGEGTPTIHRVLCISLQTHSAQSTIQT